LLLTVGWQGKFVVNSCTIDS